jgi:hypothetical protein
MGIVVILDQQMSRLSPDRVGEAADRLEKALRPGLLRPPVRTAGDEMQAVVGEPAVLPKLIELCLRWEEWWLGIGLGGIESLGETSRDSRGPAFSAAREAIEHAKTRRKPPVAVSGDVPEIAGRLQGMCDVLAFLLARRTERQWEVIDVTRARGSGSQAASLLGISPQSANEVLRSAAFREQTAVEGEIAYLAAEAQRRSDGSA